MRKIILWNKTEFFIPNNKEAPLLETMELAKAEGTGFYLNHVGGKVWIGNPKVIALITDGGLDAPAPIDHNHRITEVKLTDEQRAANIAKFSKMREDFIRNQKRKKKLAEEAKQKAREEARLKMEEGRKRALGQL